MIFEALIEANTLRDLQVALQSITAHYWNAKACHYLTYDDRRQKLVYGDEEWSLSAQSQPGACALSLRPSTDQELPWPEILKSSGAYRVSRPIFHWGSLNAVLCLEFAEAPGTLPELAEVEKVLGILGERILHREMSVSFMDRCKEVMVQAVEARGKRDHVKRCCRLSAALASMLDCSPQVQQNLMEAAQYHDLYLLTYADPESPEARREHGRACASLLRSHPDLFDVAALVEDHHERFDGSGQPAGKSGTEVPLEGWLLALVEDFVEFWENSLATYEMKVKEFFSGPATHHHPDVVDALCGLVDSEKLADLMD